MGKTIFVSIGLDDRAVAAQNLPELDKVIIKENLALIASTAAHYGHTLVLRDHPGVIPMVEYIMGTNGKKPVPVPEGMNAAQIAAAHKPDIVFFIGGDRDTADDFESIGDNVTKIVLPGTGGMAQKMDTSATGRRDIFGVERILKALMPPVPPRAPDHPAP